MTHDVITTMVIRPLDDPTLVLKSVVADLRPLSLGYVWDLEWAIWLPAHGFLLAPHWYIHMAYLVPFFELSSLPQKRFCPSSTDTMTNTALEATASSSGKNGRHPISWMPTKSVFQYVTAWLPYGASIVVTGTRIQLYWMPNRLVCWTFLLLDELIASRVVIVIVSGLGGNAFRVSQITQKL